MKPLILVSNDDGISAKGVHELVSRLVTFGDVVVVCPDAPRSGQSMAITVNQPLRLTRHADYKGAQMWSVNGTPCDCIKLAMHTLCRDRRPALVVSGINHGSNAAINTVYSGTMGAAFEACAQSIPAIGFSLTDHSPEADFSPCFPILEKIVELTLRHGLPDGICLNVNFPVSDRILTEMRLVKSARGRWSDEYEMYHDPVGKPFYWLSGRFENLEPENTDTDEYCLAHGVVSVVCQTIYRTDADFNPEWLKY